MAKNNFFKVLYGLFFYFSIHAGIIAVAWSYTICLYFKFSIDFFDYVFLFFAVLLVYNFDRTKQSKITDTINVPKRTLFLNRHKTLGMAVLGISAVFSIYFSRYLSFHSFILFFLMGSITVLYFFLASIVVKKTIILAFQKPILLAFVWSSVVSFFPFAFAKLEIPLYDLSVLWLERFIIFFINALWFDFRDRKGDQITHKLNPAVLIPERIYYFLLIGFPFLGLALSLLDIHFYNSIGLSIYFVILGVLNYADIIKRFVQKEEFYDLFVDLPLLISPILMILVI
ncbi:MAG: hypothetical protein H7A23_13450 [Leptospiraceae bacterium]|nr:hypothetical protein [Leptospiraceae bacterium]MCP5495556.1 hypothetical protein [Leptospiraceae bacterium]